MKKRIQSSAKSNADSNSDKRLNYGNERYKGYRISLDTKNGGYIVYDANGEIEDSGFKSMKSAKSFVDSLAHEAKDKVNSSAYPKHHSKIYKGYKIIVDPAGDGYNVYNKSGELEDEGIATMREAEELVDSISGVIFDLNTDKKLKSAVNEYNSASVNDSIYLSSKTLGSKFDAYLRKQGLKYGQDYICPSFRENVIIKLTDVAVEDKFVLGSEQCVDSVSVNSADATGSNDTHSRPISFQCPVCHSLAVHSTEKSIYRLADVDHDELFVCDECCSEMFARVSHSGQIKFQVHSAPSDTDWDTVESATEGHNISDDEAYCPHCGNLSLVGSGDGRAVCDSCGTEYQFTYKNGKAIKTEIISAASQLYTRSYQNEAGDVISIWEENGVEFGEGGPVGDTFRGKWTPNLERYYTGLGFTEVVSAATIDDVSFHDLVSEIFQAVRGKVKEVMTSYEFGFQEDEVDEYSTVNQEFRDNGQFCVFEIRAEVDYDGLVEFANQIDPIIQYYDPNAYFEPVTSGITEAYLSCETLRKFDENTKITSSTEVDDTVCRYKVEYYLGDNDEEKCVDYFYADSPEEAESQLIEAVGDDVRIVGSIPENVPSWYRDADGSSINSAEVTNKVKLTVTRNGKRIETKTMEVSAFNVQTRYCKEVEEYIVDKYGSGNVSYTWEPLTDSVTASSSDVRSISFNGYDVELVDGTFYVYLDDDDSNEVVYEASSTESLDNFCVGIGEAWRKKYSKSVNSANYGGAYDVDPHQYFTRDDIVDFGEYVCDHLNEIFYDTFTVYDVYIVDYSRLVLEVMRTSDESIFSCNVNIDMRKVRRPSDLKDKFWGIAVAALRSEIESLDHDVSACDTIEAAYDDVPDEPDMGNEIELEAELEFDLDTLIIVDDDGNFEYEDTTCPWIAGEADSNGDFYEPEYDVYITDVNSAVEAVSDMLVTMVPINPGRYHVTGQVKLVYNISGVHEKREYFKDYAGPDEYTDDYDSEIYSDQAEVDFLLDKSYIKNFEYEPW